MHIKFFAFLYYCIFLNEAYFVTKNEYKGLNKEELNKISIRQDLEIRYINEYLSHATNDNLDASSHLEKSLFNYLESDPKNHSIAYILGLIYKEKKESSNSIIFFKKACESSNFKISEYVLDYARELVTIGIHVSDFSSLLILYI